MRQNRWQDAAGLRHAISLQSYPLPDFGAHLRNRANELTTR